MTGGGGGIVKDNLKGCGTKVLGILNGGMKGLGVTKYGGGGGVKEWVST